MLSKTYAEKVPHVTLIGIHKKQSFVRSSETLEQQQDFLSTVPKHSVSKTHAEKVPHVTFGIHKKQSFVRSSETLEQQQDSCTC